MPATGPSSGLFTKPGMYSSMIATARSSSRISRSLLLLLIAMVLPFSLFSMIYLLF